MTIATAIEQALTEACRDFHRITTPERMREIEHAEHLVGLYWNWIQAHQFRERELYRDAVEQTSKL